MMFGVVQEGISHYHDLRTNGAITIWAPLARLGIAELSPEPHNIRNSRMVTSAVIKVDSRACCTSYSAPVEPNVKTSKIVNHIAVVTGGGRGLGRAMVLGLAQAGIQVIATAARERTEVEAVAEEVRQACGESRVLPLVADVTQEDDCAEVVVAAIKRFGRLDILVNNAGRGMKYVSDEFLTTPTRFWEVAPETWRLVIDTNVNGPFMMAKHAVPLMLKAGWGRIINVSASQGTLRRRGFSPYGPSKAALESETIIWAQDLEGTGVTVNALLPGGPTLTGMVPQTLAEQAKSSMLDPSIIVPPLLWLVSPEADGITGRRFVATKWQTGVDGRSAAEAATEQAGW
jgi:NAD(P)-dependent dehydrogenase (short-subunit alcohol dehydrogenase family)